MGGLALEGERGPLHGQQALVQAPAVGRVSDEHHVRAVEVAAFEQCHLAAAQGAAFLVRCSDDDDPARGVLHDLGQTRRRQQTRGGDQVVAAGMAVGQGVVLQHEGHRGTGAFADHLGLEGGLGDTVFDQVIGNLQIARHLVAELREFLLQQRGALDLLLAGLLEVPDLLGDSPAVRSPRRSPR